MNPKIFHHQTTVQRLYRLEVENETKRPFSLFSPNEDFSDLDAFSVLNDVYGSWKFTLKSGEELDILGRLYDGSNQDLNEKMKFIEE